MVDETFSGNAKNKKSKYNFHVIDLQKLGIQNFRYLCLTISIFIYSSIIFKCKKVIYIILLLRELDMNPL